MCFTCHTCQLTKRRKDKYRHLLSKEAKVKPWETLCINLISQYLFKKPNNQMETLHALTMIDPATGWFGMTAIKTKSSDLIANNIEQTWLSKYLWPSKIILDLGTKFTKEAIWMIEQDYRITRCPITTRNPQANSILERSHQTLGHILPMF